MFTLASAALEIGPELFARIEKKYGAPAGERIRSWQQLITASKNLPEEEKLKVVNDFFNQLEFVDDLKKWGAEDYWATPLEFIAVNGGDCEDFSIAKYFTLLEIGVPEEKLRITYVKALQYNQAHMVLTYFSSPQTTPSVLDNLNPHILPATQRKDLLPVYSFNGAGLWLAKSIGSGKSIGSPERLNLWQDLKARMQSKTGDIHIK
ncbi:MAG: transglutaminase-like cysteine peptidase [Candidatus Competibacteraceae bacterium]|nr:transglutaminase-like cysteine peptidase [Candidatus Competibacteraceae bacterium]MCP5125991.1 transglutaminase-like cysteine peptidase [Gammaproteobacteria bacterium]HRX70719.1 transglutaminase-like cysteine peptidase [Candidatus Competibacteraceae bacterium]